MLLVASLIVMMMAGFATFAAHYANSELVSVRNMRQAHRLRRANEAVLDSLIAYYQAHLPRPVSQAADIARWDGPGAGNLRANYGLPAFNGDPGVVYLRDDHLSSYFSVPLLPTDDQLSVGAVTPYTFRSELLIEVYPIDEGSGGTGMQRDYICATAFTHMLYANDIPRAGDVRGRHELVGISRAYFEAER